MNMGGGGRIGRGEREGDGVVGWRRKEKVCRLVRERRRRCGKLEREEEGVLARGGKERGW